MSIQIYASTLFGNIHTTISTPWAFLFKFKVSSLRKRKRVEKRERWSIDRYIITYSTKMSSICVTSNSIYPSNGKQTNWFNGITFVMASQLVIAFAFESCEIKHNVCVCMIISKSMSFRFAKLGIYTHVYTATAETPTAHSFTHSLTDSPNAAQ